MKKTKTFIITAFALAITSAFATNIRTTKAFSQTTGFVTGSCSTAQNIDNISGSETCNTTSGSPACTILVGSSPGVETQANDSQTNCGTSTGLLYKH